MKCEVLSFIPCPPYKKNTLASEMSSGPSVGRFQSAAEESPLSPIAPTTSPSRQMGTPPRSRHRPPWWTTAASGAAAFRSEVQNPVISSRECPLVSGTRRRTHRKFTSAARLNHQKVPSLPRYFCIKGKVWLPKYPTSQRAVVAIDVARPRTFVG